VGGVDVVCELIENGELEVPDSCKRGTPAEEIQKLQNIAPVVAFIQGSLQAPATEESKTLIDYLAKNDVVYTAVDIDAIDYIKPAIASIQVPSLYCKG